MKTRKFIITEKDFEKYGIKSHYDLDMCMDWQTDSGKKTKKSKSKRRKRRDARSKGKGIKTRRKGVSKIHGEDTGRIIKGFATTIDKDRARDVIQPSAMKEAVDDLIKEGANTVFLNHDTNVAIGRVLETQLKRRGIFVKIMISKANDVEDIWTKIKEGVFNAFSIRLRPKKVEVVENTETGRIIEFRILSMELFEVSVVGLPMNAKAAITSVIEKSFKGSIRKYNKNRGSSTMRKSKKSKSKSRQKSAAGLTEARVKEMIEDANSPMLEMLKGIQGSLDGKIKGKRVTKKGKKIRSKSKARKKSKRSPETTTDPAILELLKSMAETQKSVAKTMKRAARRKGHADDGSDDDNGVPKKVLVDATDVDTVKFVHYACNNETAYKAITVSERDLCKGIYIQCMNASAE